MPTTKAAPPRPAAALASTRAAPRESIAAASAPPPPRDAIAAEAARDAPSDVLRLIFAHLNGWQLSRCVSVCKSWRALLCGTEEYWRAALAADFVDGEQAHTLAANWSLFQHQHVARYRRVPSAMRRGAYKHALLGLQAMRRERDAHVQRTLQADAARQLDEQVEFEATHAAVAAAVLRSLQAPIGEEGAAFGLADVSEFAVAIEQAALLEREAAQLDPRSWAMVAPRERVTWRHRLRGRPFELGRSGLAAANAELRSWWLTITQPYRILWTDKPALVKHQPRRIFLPLSLQAGGARAAYLLYQTLAANLLRGRCRCCNRVTADVHARLRVPMCATRQCAGSYPAVQRNIGAAGGAEAAAQPRQRRPAWRPRNAGKRKVQQA